MKADCTSIEKCGLVTRLLSSVETSILTGIGKSGERLSVLSGTDSIAKVAEDFLFFGGEV